MASKRKQPKYLWYVLTPNNHAKGALPRRHAVLPEAGVRRAICGSPIESDAVLLRGPKTIAKHPICGRCEGRVQRFQIMADGGV